MLPWRLMLGEGLGLVFFLCLGITISNWKCHVVEIILSSLWYLLLTKIRYPSAQ